MKRGKMHITLQPLGLLALIPLINSAPAKSEPYISKSALPTNANYKTVAEAKVKDRLRDPDSAQFRWGDPYKVSCSKGVFQTPERWYGYALMLDVNAKNEFGGYTGFQPVTVLLANDGHDDIVHVPYANNIWKFGLCKRDEW